MMQWKTICRQDDLVKNTGVCARFGERQVAIFLCGKTDNLYAVDNYDPFGKANVLSRGMIGSIGEKTVIASPLYKQHFCLDSGQCIEDTAVSISTYPIRRENGDIQIGVK
ncbi:nitrite reductase small subunit NirD [Enterovibrio nigricans]|uniref:Nitrite reductase (NADH) small subunit n=1 Tax=Enterovibrio nigricans DSM 22720 TaxID=1121868 RepID=A0A1T4UWZ0_9GAMM|nr:nitrite reductase small subunit NirD [Enterovibrio nigricans]PKF50858.1 nitrite reductase (NAD(P)H) small subunit [Enterovibrio nigricans]SKA57197.1 nitrite reductase (NADH) small subunit [Enterovibrio nigricans DSM 22720]